MSGVIEPVIVRPLNGKSPKTDTTPIYELIAGERRYRASRAADKDTIPAIVRDLTDAEAMDVMIIENLHRKDLTELEEAEGFKTYVGKKGDSAIVDLAGRIGVDPRFVRRRIRILSLPKTILKEWEKGKLQYGHLEQLLRLDESEVTNFYQELCSYWEFPSVQKMKERIDNRAIPLKKAMFDVKECNGCKHNSAMQVSLFGSYFEIKDVSCHDFSCFDAKQFEYLSNNWSDTPYAKKYKTSGFRYGRFKENEYSYLYKNLVQKNCFSCENLCTIFGPGGDVYVEMACFDPVCHKKEYSRKSEPGSGNGKALPHGIIFRESFYRERIPEIAKKMPDAGEAALRLTLSALLHSNHRAKTRFANRHGVKEWLSLNADLWFIIEKMDSEELYAELKDAAVNVVLQADYSHDARTLVSMHLGIDLRRDWLLHEEYLKKKTIREIIAFGTGKGDLSGPALFADPKIRAFLKEHFNIDNGKFEKCKKDQLIACILKSGVDLSGYVPREIWDVKIKTDDQQSMPPVPGDTAVCPHLNERVDAGFKECAEYECCSDCGNESCLDRCARSESCACWSEKTEIA